MPNTPTFATDPEEIASHILSLPVTSEPIAGGPEDAMDPWDRETMEYHFEHVRRGNPTTIRVLRRLVRKYPAIPSLKNHLYVGYMHAGRKRQAAELLDEIFALHPSYLFGRTAVALKRIDAGDLDGARELLGESLRLSDLYPQSTLFHFSELKVYYQSVGELHLKAGRPDAAAAVLGALEEIVGERDPLVEALRYSLEKSRAEQFRRILKEDREREVIVEVPEPASRPDSGFLPPSFHHREITKLYEHGFDLPTEVLSAILALPRETLVADLVAVVKDGRSRHRHFFNEDLENDEDSTTFVIHAIFLLGELRAVETLPAIYEVLGESDEWLNFWLAHDLGIDLWRPLLQLFGDRLDDVAAWLLTPERPFFSRSLLTETAVKMVRVDSSRREEVIAWLGRLLAAMVEAVPGDGVLDTRFATSLVGDAMELSALELRPLVVELYRLDRIGRGWVGELADFDRAMEEPSEGISFEDLATLYQKNATRYERFSQRLEKEFGDGEEDEGWEEEEFPAGFGFQPPESDLDRLTRSLGSRSGPVVNEALKVGRNDPCPCGSGRKFKKCCG